MENRAEPVVIQGSDNFEILVSEKDQAKLERRRIEEEKQAAELQKNYDEYQASKQGKYGNNKLWKEQDQDEFNKYTNMIDNVLGSPEK